jgi:transposase
MVLIDQAGWHTTGKIEVPDNISIIALPAKCPELNPVENIWQFMRENWLPNRIFRPCDTSSTTAVMPGTSLSISPGTS